MTCHLSSAHEAAHPGFIPLHHAGSIRSSRRRTFDARAPLRPLLAMQGGQDLPLASTQKGVAYVTHVLLSRWKARLRAIASCHGVKRRWESCTSATVAMTIRTAMYQQS